MKVVAILALVLTLCQGAYAQTNALSANKETFEALLQEFCSAVPCGARPAADTEAGARAVISGALTLAALRADDALKEFNAPLKEMKIEAMFVPEKDVADAVCKYYGYSVGEYKELKDALASLAVSPGFYAAPLKEPAAVVYKVDNVSVLKNGLTAAEGTYGPDAAPFKAFFKKSSCGGKSRWVPLNFVPLRLPEEADDYKIPQDK